MREEEKEMGERNGIAKTKMGCLTSKYDHTLEQELRMCSLCVPKLQCWPSWLSTKLILEQMYQGTDQG